MKRDLSGDALVDVDPTENVEQLPKASRLSQFRFEAGPESRFKSPSKPKRVEQVVPRESCLPPMEPEDTCSSPRFLILGSAPSVESLAQQRYYAHKYNHFWQIIPRVFDVGCSADVFMQQEYEDRVKKLCASGVVVWDMCKDFVRPGSADSNLKCQDVNDIGAILSKYPTIKMVGLNGQASFKLFKKHIVKEGKLPAGVEFSCLPSTSPLNAMKDAVAVKAAKWREALGLGSIAGPTASQ